MQEIHGQEGNIQAVSTLILPISFDRVPPRLDTEAGEEYMHFNLC